MSVEIIMAIISLCGSVATLIGTIASVIQGNKLTAYRIEQLEKRVNQHNSIVDRTYKLEQHQAVVDEEIKVANHRISDLERNDD